MSGCRFIVLCPYPLFTRRWARALVGGRWHGFWYRFHLRIGVCIRRRVRLMLVVCREPNGTLRRRYLNPRQIAWIEPIHNPPKP